MQKLTLSVLLLVIHCICFGQTQNKQNSPTLNKLLDSTYDAFESGNYSKSLEYNIQLIEEASKKNDSRFLIKGYRYLGYNYLVIKDTILAKRSLKKAEDLAKKLKEDKLLSLVFMDKANYFSTFKQVDSSLFYHKKSIRGFKKLKDTFKLVTAYYNIMTTYSGIDKLDSLGNYLKELENYENSISKSYKVSFDNLRGDYLSHKGKLEEANSYYEKIINDSINEKYTSELVSAYYMYSENLYSMGRYKDAYNARLYYEDYEFLERTKVDSASTNETASSFQIKQFKKDIKETELRNEIQSLKVKTHKRWIIFLLLVLFMSVLLLSVLWTLFSNKRKFINKLKHKNELYLKAKEAADMLAKTKTAFFSTVSHELRTPLYGVIGLSSIFIEDPKLKNYKDDMKSLKFSADYLLALINDVLYINKIEAKAITGTAKSIDLRSLIKEIITSFEYLRLQNNNEIYLHIDKDIPNKLLGHSTQLSRVLFNLIGNACKFTKNGNIEVNLKKEYVKEKKARILFNIEDTGVGIPLEKQESIFQEFSQVNSEKHTHEGTGLGLPIVKKILEQNNEEIFLESKPNEGTRFYFSLTFDLDLNLPKPRLLENNNECMLKGKHILVVDDNKINQVVTIKTLKKSNVKCDSAFNGVEAVECAKMNNFDLILMDINMPVKNGIEASREIRMFNKSVPIIALTAAELHNMEEEIYESGINDIIVKPYDFDKFIDTIKRNIKKELNNNTTKKVHA